MSKRNNKSINKNARGTVIDINALFRIECTGGRRRVDVSCEAYLAKDPNFKSSLCECEMGKCCHLHHHDFDELIGVINETSIPF